MTRHEGTEWEYRYCYSVKSRR